MFNAAFQGEEHQAFHFEGRGKGAVILTHGFPGTPKEMRPVARVLNAMGWTTHGVLMPGYGADIEHIAEKTAEQWFKSIETPLLELKKTHDTVLMAGNSTGGALSIQAVARHGADGLMLFAPFLRVDHFLWSLMPFIRPLLPKFKPFKLFKPDFNDEELVRGIHNFMPQADVSDPEFQRGMVEFEVDTRIFEQLRRAGQSGYDYAPQVNVPTLIIQGRQDELVKPQVTRSLMERLKGKITYVEVDAPHNPIQKELACWPQVAEAVQQFASQFEVKEGV
ncbi:MAG: alpha/beta hydrolase [Phototrophicaceae bacterium]